MYSLGDQVLTLKSCTHVCWTQESHQNAVWLHKSAITTSKGESLVLLQLKTSRPVALDFLAKLQLDFKGQRPL